MTKNYSIVGMEHRKAEAFVAALPVGAEATLIREPNNPWDPCAIAVWINGKHVGYLPKKQNVALAKRIDDTGNVRLAMDTIDAPAGKSIPAKFIRSPNSGYPMVEVSE